MCVDNTMCTLCSPKKINKSKKKKQLIRKDDMSADFVIGGLQWPKRLYILTNWADCVLLCMLSLYNTVCVC